MGITYTVHDTGTPLDGMTFTNGRHVANHSQAGDCVDFGRHTINGKAGSVMVRTSGKPDLQKLVKDYYEEIAKLPYECARCSKEFPREQAAFRRVRIGAMNPKLPHCPACEKFLFETVDGFGECVGSSEPADLTTIHKEQDY